MPHNQRSRRQNWKQLSLRNSIGHYYGIGAKAGGLATGVTRIGEGNSHGNFFRIGIALSNINKQRTGGVVLKLRITTTTGWQEDHPRRSG